MQAKKEGTIETKNSYEYGITYSYEFFLCVNNFKSYSQRKLLSHFAILKL